MPIRINLLAEQQEAEEARRRDPIKRAIFIACAIVAGTILLIISFQFQVASTRSELEAVQLQLQETDTSAKEVRTDWQRINDANNRTDSLIRYATNRFFWAPAMDALQRTVVDGVRIMAIDGSQAYRTNSETRFKTNIVFQRPVHSRWQFWSKPAEPDAGALLAAQLLQITNRTQFATNKIPVITKISFDTNATRITASVEIIKPATATEHITLLIDARDYNDPPGKHLDDFSRAIGSLPYFKDRLHVGEGEGIRLKERAIRPELDSQDFLLPNKPYIPFTIECQYQDKVRAND